MIRIRKFACIVVALVVVALALVSVLSCTSQPAATGSPTPTTTVSPTPTTTGSPRPTATASPAPTATGQVINLRYGAFMVAGDPTSKLADWFAKEIADRTKGRVQIKVYYAQELGKINECLQLLGSGAYDMGNGAPSYFPAQQPLAAMANSIYGLFPNMSAAGHFFDEMNKTIPAVVQETTAVNLKALFPFSAPSYYFLSKVPMDKLSDLKGLKVRTFGVYLPKHVQNFGGVSVSVAAPDVYEALASGIIDVDPDTTSNMVTLGLSANAKHLYLLKVGITPWGPAYMNLDAWNKLPNDIQTVFSDVCGEMVEQDVKVWGGQADAAMVTLKNSGVTFHEVSKSDQEAWDAYGRVLLDGWTRDMESKGLGDAAHQINNLYLQVLAKYP